VSQSFAQFVPANFSPPSVGASGTFPSAPPFNPPGNTARSIFSLDIRRGLGVHRRLAIGLALIGVALSLIYLLNSWSIRTAPSLNEPQLAPSGNFAGSPFTPIAATGPRTELLRTKTAARHDGRDPIPTRQFQHSFPMENRPGLPGLTAAVTPWYAVDSGVMRNALVLLLSFVFLGAAIAIIAHRADPRVYIPSHVEQLLGFPPMAQLPDFSEVADEIAEEHLMRLASGIDLGFKDRGFRRCVFTGTGPEVGVTTVATRIRKSLESTGRAAVIADAAGGANETETIQREMILFDAAPLAASEETERLVKSAHCTIVVIQSGVTTRAQLRTVANILQRLKVPAVGFVLNRVRLATADPQFRRSIRQMGKQLRKQGHATDSQLLQTLEDAIEEGRATLDLDAASTSKQPATKPLERIVASTPRFDESFRAEKPAPANPTEPIMPPAGQRIQLVPRSLPEPANQTRNNIPSPLAEIASQFDQLHPEMKAEQSLAPTAPPGNPIGNGTGSEPANPTPGKTTRYSLPRLSELRGMRFSQALRGLDHAKRSAAPNSGIEILMNAIAPFEQMFTRMQPAANNSEDSPDATPAEFALPASLRAFIPISESGVSPEPNDAASAEQTNANRNHFLSNSLLPKPGLELKKKGPRGEESERSQPEQSAAEQKTGTPFEQLQILPSRHGQYKKKR
jgi:hypothetical protein